MEIAALLKSRLRWPKAYPSEFLWGSHAELPLRPLNILDLHRQANLTQILGELTSAALQGDLARRIYHLSQTAGPTSTRSSKPASLLQHVMSWMDSLQLSFVPVFSPSEQLRRYPHDISLAIVVHKLRRNSYLSRAAAQLGILYVGQLLTPAGTHILPASKLVWAQSHAPLYRGLQILITDSPDPLVLQVSPEFKVSPLLHDPAQRPREPVEVIQVRWTDLEPSDVPDLQPFLDVPYSWAVCDGSSTRTFDGTLSRCGGGIILKTPPTRLQRGIVQFGLPKPAFWVEVTLLVASRLHIPAPFHLYSYCLAALQTISSPPTNFPATLCPVLRWIHSAQLQLKDLSQSWPRSYAWIPGHTSWSEGVFAAQHLADAIAGTGLLIPSDSATRWSTDPPVILLYQGQRVVSPLRQFISQLWQSQHDANVSSEASYLIPWLHPSPDCHPTWRVAWKSALPLGSDWAATDEDPLCCATMVALTSWLPAM